MVDQNLWDPSRVDRYIKLYGDPRETKGSQSQLCKDSAAFILHGTSVLDVGCGMGHLIPFLSKGMEYVGLDSSEPMLAQLVRFFGVITIVQRDARDFDLEQQFDTVISNSLFIHLEREDAKRTMKTMWRHTKPGGSMGFSMETLQIPEQRRPDGLLIRNQPVDDIVSDMRNVIGYGPHISWIHQRAVYQAVYEVIYSRGNPLGTDSMNLIARTTLFRVDKPSEAAT